MRGVIDLASYRHLREAMPSRCGLEESHLLPGGTQPVVSAPSTSKNRIPLTGVRPCRSPLDTPLPRPVDDQHAWVRDLLVERAEEDDCDVLLTSDMQAWLDHERSMPRSAWNPFSRPRVAAGPVDMRSLPDDFAAHARTLYGVRNRMLHAYRTASRKLTVETLPLRLCDLVVREVGPSHVTATLTWSSQPLVIPWIAKASLPSLAVEIASDERTRFHVR